MVLGHAPGIDLLRCNLRAISAFQHSFYLTCCVRGVLGYLDTLDTYSSVGSGFLKGRFLKKFNKASEDITFSNALTVDTIVVGLTL